MSLLLFSPCLLHIGCQGIQPPGLAVGPAPHAVGFLVVHERTFGGIPGHLAAQLARDVRAMGGDVGVTGGLGIGARQRPRADAVQQVLDVAGGICAAHGHCLVVLAEIVGHFHFAGIPRLDPAFGPFEAHPARTAVPPAVAAEDEFHAVGVGAVYMAGARLRIVLDRVSVVAISGPLADVAGVGGPLQNPGMEVPELAPSAIRVAGVIRAPRTWTQPLVPIEDQRIGLWPFFGPPTVAQRSLFYRLNVFPIPLPPLRERREDIPLLVRYFTQKYARRMNRPIETIPSEAMEALTNWNWPGNVRELENLMERAVILTRGSVLHVPLAELRNGGETAAPAMTGALSTLEEAEREHVLRALRECNWVVTVTVAVDLR